MTTSEPARRRGRENAAQRWLEQQFRRMVDDLHGVLDLDAGLHEILVTPQHEKLVRDLGRVFDLDAGLRDILGPASREPIPPGIGAPRTDDTVDVARVLDSAALDAVLAARANRAVRRCLDLLAAARVDDVAGVVEYAGDAVDLLAFEGADAITFARARAMSGIDARDLVDELGSPVIGLDAFVHTPPDADFDICQAARAHARALVHALIKTRLGIRAILWAFSLANGTVDPFTQVLIEAFDRSLSDAYALARSLVKGLAATRTRAGDLPSRVGDAQDRAATVIRSLLSILEGIVVEGLSRTLPGIDLEQLPAERIRSLLDDFTGADLREANLADADLTGLQWSNATRWPLELVSAIRWQSREIEPGSGKFVIVGGVRYTETTNH